MTARPVLGSLVVANYITVSTDSAVLETSLALFKKKMIWKLPKFDVLLG